jgi:glycosyltransferase involved in cell wall biosynthesis
VIKSNVNILFLTRLYYPHIGGVEKHIANLSSELIKQGHKVTVLTTQHEKNLPGRENILNVDVIRFEQPNIKLFGLFYTWYWLFRHRTLIGKSDIVHIHDVFIWYWPFKILYRRSKVFVTFHGQWGKFPIQLADLIQKKIGAKLSNGVITIGKYINKNYRIASNMVSYGAGYKISKETNKQKIIAYVGRLDQNTGLPLFLALLNHKDKTFLKEYKVVFCGEGELRGECEEFGKVLGWSDPAKLYAKSKFIFASGYLTIIEALTNRCLVIAGYNHNLQKDYYELTHFNKFVFASDKPDKLLQRIELLNQNPTEAKKIIKMGYNWAIRQTWSKLAQSYQNLWSV